MADEVVLIPGTGGPKAPKGHCHFLVAKVAKEMAGTVFEEKAKQSNQEYLALREAYPDKTSAQLQKMFIAKNWYLFVPAARSILAQMLRSPIEDAMKADIEEALIKDNALRFGREMQA